jgi:dTDP-4-amino-4,6-dideoxygalactose transaminase
MIPRYKPYFDLKEAKSLFNKSNTAIYEFENKFSEAVGAKYAITFPSGRTGLYALFKSLDLSNKKIITPAYTCVVVPTSIVSSNNIPVFVDIYPDTSNINVEELAKIDLKYVRAIVPTHMYGNPVDIKKIRELVGEDVFIIEDAAQAILSKNVGRFGDATFYSFNFEKQIFTFGGGMVTTNNKNIYEKLIKFKEQNIIKRTISREIQKSFSLISTQIIFSNMFFRFFSKLWDINSLISWKKQGWDFDDEKLPVDKVYLNSDLKDFFSKTQASVGICQINKIKENIRKRKEIAEYYDSQLDGINGIITPPLNSDSSYSHYTIHVNDRNRFENFMKKRNIQINKVFEYSIPHIPAFSKYNKSGKSYGNSFIAGKNNTNLPIYPQLLNKPEKLKHIADSVKEYCNKIIQI